MHGEQHDDGPPRDARELLRVITDATADGIITIDVTSTIRFANPAVEKIFGYEADELLGQPLTKLMPEYLRHVHERAIGRYLDTGVRHIDWTGIALPGLHRDGHEIALDVSFGESTSRGQKLFTAVIRDVTERQRAEEERRQTSERFHLLVDAVEEYGILMLDAEGCVSSWNAGAERIKGYTADEIVGQHLSRFYTREDVEAGKPRRALATARAEGRYLEEGPRVRKDGATFWASVVITALYSDDGTLRGFGEVTRDITERKQVEEERTRLIDQLRRERRTLHEVFTQAPAFIAALRGPDHRYEIANPLYLELAGRRDIIGKTVREVLPEVEAQGYVELLDRAYGTGETFTGQEMPIEIQREGDAAPTRYYINLALQPLREADGSISGIFAHGVDVTEQVLARQKIERLALEAEASRAQLEAVLGNMNEALLICDARGVLLTMNAAAREVYGYGSLEEARDRIGDRHQRFEIEDLDGGALPREEWPLARALRGDRFSGLELRIRQRDPDREWIGSFNGTAVRDADGGVALAILTLQDITERKRAEEEVRALNVHLEQRVADRTEDLEAAVRELGTFNYTVSHDLRAPLRGIDGFSQILLEDYANSLDETAQGYLRRIRSGAERMGELIDSLLKLSRLSSEEMHEEEVNLSHLAREVVRDLEEHHAARQVEVSIADGLVTRGDPVLLRAVLENLLGNALKFTRDEEVARIDVGRAPDPDRSVFFVRDNGAGFDMAYAGKLFTPFQRLHGRERFEGSGIGLATVQRIVHRHGGKVWAEGEVGQGATFYFTLPGEGAAAATKAS